MKKLKDMAERIKAAYVELVVGGPDVALIMSECDNGDYWLFWRHVRDTSYKVVPKSGRAAILLMNTLPEDAMDTNPFRIVFINDLAKKEGTIVSGDSLVYEPGEEENAALNLREFLIDNLGFNDMTFDDMGGDHE